MDERLTSRFNAGMLCLVAEPSYEMKYKILQRYYENTIVAAPDGRRRLTVGGLRGRRRAPDR
jgi:chromosomal replication initiator protein DnaA